MTGKKAEMDKLLRALTGDPAGVTEHSAIAFIGNYDLGVWIRADALDRTDEIDNRSRQRAQPEGEQIGRISQGSYV